MCEHITLGLETNSVSYLSRLDNVPIAQLGRTQRVAAIVCTEDSLAKTAVFYSIK